MNKQVKRITILFILIVVIVFWVRFLTYDVFSPGSGNFDDAKDFVDNQVELFFYENVSFFQIKWFLIRINGKLDAYGKSIINYYAVTLEKTFENEEEVLDYCSFLMNKYHIIEDCDSNGIIKMIEPDVLIEN